MNLKMSNYIPSQDDLDEDEELLEEASNDFRRKPGELILPTPASSFISTTQSEEWESLMDAYRRVVGDFLSDIEEDENDTGIDDDSSGVVIEPGKSELVIVRGGAGTGKSFLLKRLRLTQNMHGGADDNNRDASGMFIQGNFDRKNAGAEKAAPAAAASASSGAQGRNRLDGGRPYAAFVDALEAACDIVIRAGGEAEFRASINEVVGRGSKERDLLTNLVPRLRHILGESHQGSAARRRRSLLASDSSKGLQFVFRKFIRALGRYSYRIRGGPLVLSLEDGECIDSASLGLLHSISTDPRSKGVLIVLSVRDEMIDTPLLLPNPEDDGELNDGQQEEATEETKEEVTEETKEEATEETKEEATEETKDEGNGEVQEEEKGDSDGSGPEPKKGPEPETPLQKILHEIQQTDSAIALSEITISNLDESTLNSLISNILRQDPQSITSLSSLIHRKTLGNPLFAVQFLKSLVDNNLLTYNFNMFKWKWDLETIQAQTNVTDNVVNLFLVNTIQRLDDVTQFTVMLASCLNSTTVLDSEVLTSVALAVVQGSDSSSYNYPVINGEEMIQDALDVAINEGLMERVSATVVGTKVKFSHDRIIQGCRTLMPSQEDVAAALHLNIGNALRQIYSNTEGTHEAQSWMLFSAVDHLNIAAEYNSSGNDGGVGDDWIELVNLNLEAGEMATSLSAFVPASDYLSKGLELIPKSQRWTSNNYDLSLKIHSELASTLYCCGRMDECHDTSNEVLNHAKTLQEKFRCYLNIIALLKAGGKLEESVKVGIEFLSQLGEPFQLKPSKWKLKSEAKATKKLLQKYSDDQLLNLPDCTDDCKGMAVYVLGMLFGPMVHLNHQGALDYLRLRSVRLTVEYGVCDASALAYAYYGSHLISSKDVDLNGGYRFGKLALQLVDRLESTELKARTILLSNFLCVHWKDPLPKTLDRLMEGYSVGMLNGDIEMAFTCAGIYQQHYYYCGLSLLSGEKDIREFCAQMKEYKQTKELKQAQPLWQAMLNLMGEAAHPVLLTGDAMDQHEFENGKMGVVVMKSYQMQLAYYFDDLDLAESCMETLRSQSGGFTAPFFQVARRFFFALISIGLARKVSSSKRRKAHLKQAKSDVEWLKERVQKGGINCLHKLMLLEAELKSFTKQKDLRQLYDKAIMTSNRNGFMQDQALGNELAGLFCYESGDLYWSTFYFERAVALYEEWGAFGKANHLKVKYPDVLDKEGGRRGIERDGSGSSSKIGLRRSKGSRRSLGSGHLGRRRFSSRLSDSHKSLRRSFGSLGSDL